jgi:hypothetical protein
VEEEVVFARREQNRRRDSFSSTEVDHRRETVEEGTR